MTQSTHIDENCRRSLRQQLSLCASICSHFCSHVNPRLGITEIESAMHILLFIGIM